MTSRQLSLLIVFFGAMLTARVFVWTVYLVWLYMKGRL